jgi:hypothetical protein
MKFSMRDLFLLTLVVALAFGWLVDHWQYDSKFKEGEAWRHRAAVLEDYLVSDEKMQVVWRDVDVLVFRPNNGMVRMVFTEVSEPSRVWSWPEMPNSSAPAPNPPRSDP